VLFSIFSAGAVVFNLVAGHIDLRWSFAGLLVMPWLAIFTI